MKNPVILISLLILSFLCIRHQVNAQQPPCIPEAVLVRLFNDATDCVSNNLPPEALSVTVVKVNFHFIGNEFYGGQPGDNSVFNGNKLANDVVMKLNEYMANILPNPVQSANFIGDSRIRFELYSDPNESTDTHGGVWYWAQTQNIQDVYADDVMKITIWPIGVGGGASGQAGCTNIALPCVSVYGTKAQIEAQGGASTGYNEHAYVARIVAHEVGHVTGLCHSFSNDNPCSDISALAECGGSVAGSPAPACGGPPSQDCEDELSSSNNIMAYREIKRSLSPCQWRTYYGFLFNNRPNWVRVESLNCSNTPPLPGPPLIIPAGTNEVWDELRFVFDDVIIETGATLRITCQALIAAKRSITVRRGAKLIVENGEISNLYDGLPWAGIFVEGNEQLPQPNPQSVFLPAANQAGIVYLDGAFITGASTAISTSRLGEHYNAAYWGGVVFAQNSEFINNRRAVEFMKFRNTDPATGVYIDNRSAFIDCIFADDNAPYTNTEGVTIWGCNGIRFDQCLFRNFDIAGIYGIDYGMHVLNNTSFKNCVRGIEVFATRPIAGHRVLVENSLFENSDANLLNNSSSAHIYAESTSEIDGLFVINENQFERGRRGILVDGPAQVNIVRNTFNRITSASAHLIACEDNNFNELTCNTFYNGPSRDVSIVGPNPKFTFKYNDFMSNATLGHLILVRLGNLPGSISNRQGYLNDPARNCFTRPLAIRAIINQTIPFTYFAQAASGCTYWIPQINLSDGGNNNYEVRIIEQSTEIIAEDCTFIPPQPAPELDKDDLAAVDVVLNGAANDLAVSPTSPIYLEAYQKAQQTRQLTLTDLLRGQRARGRYDLMEEVLLTESSEQARRWLLSVYIENKQWAKAQANWQALPQITPDQQAFRDIMGINIDLLSEGPQADIDPIQEVQLYTIAESQLPSRSYARSLLALYRGLRFPVEEDEFGEALQMMSQPTTPSADFVRLHPNPVSDWLQFHFSPDEIGQTATFELTDLHGRPLKNWAVEEVLDDHRLDLNPYPTGIYFLRVQIGSQFPEIHKIVKR